MKSEIAKIAEEKHVFGLHDGRVLAEAFLLGVFVDIGNVALAALHLLVGDFVTDGLRQSFFEVK